MITFGYNNKFSTALRALAAIGIGLVMVFSTEATVNVVKIIAACLQPAWYHWATASRIGNPAPWH